MNRFNVLLIAPYFDRSIAGESFVSYKWVEGISEFCDTTVLTTHKANWSAANSPTKAKEVINWTDPKLPAFLRRLDFELKPGYVMFYWRARRWIKAQARAGRKFDLVHQINPVAMRYPCPAIGTGYKFIVGPFGGGIRTPAGFAREGADRQWYRKLRNIDRWRYAKDPWLRSSYVEAEAFIGVAPYVRELLADLPLKRFEAISEAGCDPIEHATAVRNRAPGEPVRLLFVGRVIRTKGVIDAVRAVGAVAKSRAVTFDVIGDGDALPTCRAEAARLGIESIVRFHGRLPKAEALEWYNRCDIFLFPSFREPTGQVVVEAMQRGLPVITSTLGGPGFFVDENCGIQVEPKDPRQYVEGLAAAVVRLVDDSKLRERMGAQAISRIASLVDWSSKFDSVKRLYDDVILGSPASQLARV